MKTLSALLSFMLLVALVITTGCSSDSGSAMEEEVDIFFPQQVVQSGGDLNISEAIIEGKLEAQTGCLIVEAPAASTPFVPIWPPDYSLRVQNDVVQILRPDGQVAVTVGEDVVVSGLETTAVEVVLGDSEAQELKNRCPGRYWVVGSDIGALN